MNFLLHCGLSNRVCSRKCLCLTKLIIVTARIIFLFLFKCFYIQFWFYFLVIIKNRHGVYLLLFLKISFSSQKKPFPFQKLISFFVYSHVTILLYILSVTFIVCLRSNIDLCYLLLVTSYWRELGSFKFADGISVCGTSLVQDPRTIDFPDVPEIQKRVLKYTLFRIVGSLFRLFASEFYDCF